MNSATERNINNHNPNPMTRFSIGEEDDEEEEDTPALIVKRPRLSDNASQSRTPDDVVPVPEMQSDGGVAVANNLPNMNNMNSSTVGLGMRVFVTDTDVLDCPICLDPLSAPVFQCENGHIACSSCCKKVKRKCPCCCMPIGYNRCRAVEKVVESFTKTNIIRDLNLSNVTKVSCKNARYGCRRILTYSKQAQHEQMCKHAACFCPYPSCPFSGSSKNMYLHFGMQHVVSTTRFTYDIAFFVNVELHQKHIFLQEQHERAVFILNHEVKEHGRALSVDCVGPSTLKACFLCDITATDPVSSLYLQSVPEVYRKCSEHPLRKMYLTIPSDLFGTETMLIQLCIKKVVSPA
ncbi:putative E3 ubiquitin-protein ligase SINA-like 6 [Bidens hawaiensis]|uniref:putative E3 ubiquitin-protein ligase SINA-like 6 n=1 Tax=Bidens hawaiensis TaxID=980011 RepID=UPI00404AB8B4